jgi:hypothetical protein
VPGKASQLEKKARKSALADSMTNWVLQFFNKGDFVLITIEKLNAKATRLLLDHGAKGEIKYSQAVCG